MLNLVRNFCWPGRFELKTTWLVVVACVMVGMGGSGCTRSTAPAAMTRSSALEQQQAMEAAREELEQIPPPSKTRYLAVKSLDVWENPYVTVQPGMLTIHVVTADANTSQLGVGGMLRPLGARRQNLNVRLTELTAALNAIPENSWPYGRVVAVEEAHDTPESARPTVRRNMEAVMKTLNDLGVVVYEWSDNGAK